MTSYSTLSRESNCGFLYVNIIVYDQLDGLFLHLYTAV